MKRASAGFTLIELLVVIGIFVVLTAIMLPIGKRLTEANRASSCQSHLQRIGQALKMYYIDEQGVPPVAAAADGTVDFDDFPALGVLWRLDYLKNRETLHCPRMVDANGKTVTHDSPDYFRSYMLRDPSAKPSTETLKQFKYMPYRFATQADYPNDYARQLTRNTHSEKIGTTTYTITGSSSSMPPDDTVVTWCNYHAATYTMDKHGQYLVLYWDGSVRVLDQELFNDSTTDPPEAWLVKPTDIAH